MHIYIYIYIYIYLFTVPRRPVGGHRRGTTRTQSVQHLWCEQHSTMTQHGRRRRHVSCSVADEQVSPIANLGDHLHSLSYPIGRGEGGGTANRSHVHSVICSQDDVDWDVAMQSQKPNGWEPRPDCETWILTHAHTHTTHHFATRGAAPGGVEEPSWRAPLLFDSVINKIFVLSGSNVLFASYVHSHRGAIMHTLNFPSMLTQGGELRRVFRAKPDGSFIVLRNMSFLCLLLMCDLSSQTFFRTRG
jgi:hypothetical protein